MSVLTEHMLRAVGRRLDFRSGLLVPEAVVSYVTGFNATFNYERRDEYLADLMWVTSAGYATEFEIKVSRADWRADNAKGKWGFMPPWLSRFIYVVPVELGIPDFVRPEAGVWHYAPTRYYHAQITVARAPKRIGTQKVPRETTDRWLGHLHCRFWHQRLYFDKRLPAVQAEAA